MGHWMQWRPKLRTLFISISLVVLILPLASIFLLRLYESALVRQTEASLIAQASWIVSSYKQRLKDSYPERDWRQYGNALPKSLLEKAKKTQSKWHPQPPTLDLNNDHILAKPPNAIIRQSPQDTIALSIGQQLQPILKEVQLTTLAGIRIVDSQGIIIASTGQGLGASLVNRIEVEQALAGYPIRVLRRRISDEPRPMLTSISRGTGVRIFLAHPIIFQQRIVAAVILSRTPPDIFQVLYAKRYLFSSYGLILLLLVILIAWFTSFSITKPIKALVNAPSIRPLIQYFELDKLTDNENLELKQGMEKARSVVDQSLQNLINSGILSDPGLQQIRTNIDQLLPQENIELNAQQQQRQYKLNALQLEQETLNKLYKAKVISGYVYVDLRTEFIRAREHIHNPERAIKNNRGRQQNHFIRFEDSMIKRLREKDWAIQFLSRYQNMRLSQRLSKSLAQILITETAKQFVQNEKHIDASVQEKLLGHYDERLSWFHANISAIKNDFPEFYHHFEIFLSSRSALISAKNEVAESGQHGFISAKPLHLLERQIEQAFASIPAASLSEEGPGAKQLLQRVPLFKFLTHEVLEKLAEHIHKLYFLSNDIIIGEGEHGDALYLISQGRVEVSRKESDDSNTVLAQLSSGNFFGEAALLGESTRTATVKAITSVTLLRLRRKDVLKIAEQHPEIKEHLNAANEERHASAKSIKIE